MGNSTTGLNAREPGWIVKYQFWSLAEDGPHFGVIVEKQAVVGIFDAGFRVIMPIFIDESATCIGVGDASHESA